jgi:4-hydroxyphenylpyruvate dioxygenase
MSVNEMLPDPTNILGMNGIEFIEYTTKQPQQFCMLLEKLGFVLVARHRSREVLLFKQGDMNLIVNSDTEGLGEDDDFSECPVISGVAFRVQNAHFAHQRAIALGGWPIATRASAMELNVPGIRSVGQSTIYFVDRYKDFSIYDVDFIKLPNVVVPPAVGSMNYFGLVQTAYEGCTSNWSYFYSKVLGFTELPPNQFFGILQKGVILQSPCKSFHIQIIEPPTSDVDWSEEYLRLAFGANDILAVSKVLHENGISFVDHEKLHTTTKGALTQPYLGGVQFELVNNSFKG